MWEYESGTQDEDLDRVRRHLRDACCAVAVVGLGGPLSGDDLADCRGLGDRLGLPSPMASRLAEVAGTGAGDLELEIAPRDLSETAGLAARLLLLGRRLGHPHHAAAKALAGKLDLSRGELSDLDEAVRAGAARRQLDRSAAWSEFARGTPFVRSAVDALGAVRGAPPRRLVGKITPSRYRHPLDVQATRSVSRVLPFEDAARKFSENLPEKQLKLLNAASHIRVGPDQFGELYAVYQGCVERMGIEPEPPLFLAMGGMNAYTSGVEEPFVVLNDTLVGVLTRSELEFVIGHELGHVKFEHVLYSMIAMLLQLPASVVRTIPFVGPLLGMGLELALYEWQRKAELSCDRAGLLCCQDPEGAFRVMMRFAGAPAVYTAAFNVDAFIDQYKELEAQWEDLSSKMLYALQTMTRSHPWAAVRAKELRDWIDSGAYAELLEECPEQSGGPVSAILPTGVDELPTGFACGACGARAPAGYTTCPACRSALAPAMRLLRCGACAHECPPGHRFCEACGQPLGGPE